MRIALDAMGGDYAPKNIIEGAVLALKELPDIEKLFLVGDATTLGNELKRLDCKDPRVNIYHASEVVSMKESAAKAVRTKKDASICRAVDLVKSGAADAVVSAGHTGAAVAACVLKLRTLKGIERPAVACLLPTKSNVFVLIDAGANPDSTPENLVQFAIMGSVFSEHVLGYKNPSVALMSIGEEDMKGNDVTKEAFKLLRASKLNFRGNIEGHDLFERPRSGSLRRIHGQCGAQNFRSNRSRDIFLAKTRALPESDPQTRRQARRRSLQIYPEKDEL
jgi:phosphate acyltransferase